MLMHNDDGVGQQPYEEAEALSQLVHALRAHVDALEDENRGLKTELDGTLSAGKNMMDKLMEKDQEIDALTHEVRGSRQDMESNDASLDGRIRRLMEENAALLQNSTVEVNAAVAERERALHRLGLESEKVAKMSISLQHVTEKLEEADVTVEKLEALLNEGKAGVFKEVAEEVAAKYEPRIEDYARKQKMLVEGVDKLEDAIRETEDRLSAEKTTLMEKVAVLENELAVSQKVLKHDNERLLAELRTATAAGDDVAARLAVQQSTSATRAHEAEYAIATLETDLAEQAAHTNLIETEVRTLRAEKLGLKVRVEELEGYLAALGGDGYLSSHASLGKRGASGGGGGGGGGDGGGLHDESTFENIELDGEGGSTGNKNKNKNKGREAVVEDKHAGNRTLPRTADTGVGVGAGANFLRGQGVGEWRDKASPLSAPASASGPDGRPRSAGETYGTLRRQQKSAQESELAKRMMDLEQTMLEQRTMWLMGQRDMKDRLRKAGASPSASQPPSSTMPGIANAYGNTSGNSSAFASSSAFAYPSANNANNAGGGYQYQGSTSGSPGHSHGHGPSADAVSSWYQQRASLLTDGGGSGSGAGVGVGVGSGAGTGSPRAPLGGGPAGHHAASPRQGSGRRYPQSMNEYYE